MYKRIISLSIAVLFLFACIGGRVGYISLSKNYVVDFGKNSYSFVIDNKQPTVYYRSGIKATNNCYRFVAVVKPNPKCVGELNKLFSNSKCDEIIEELKKGKPVLVYLDSCPTVQLKAIKIYKALSSNNNLYQIISKSSNGLLNHIASPIGKYAISFSIDANGRMLDGDEGITEKINYDSNEGYQISIDEQIQNIAVKASSNMKSGCVVVMDVNDSSILACVNKPFDDYNIKAFGQYCVGSVFKIVVACCALENNCSPIYDCKGTVKVGDTQFRCQNGNVHSVQGLKQALANSCNCYFVNLALTLGRDKLLVTCNKLGFDSYTRLFDDWDILNAQLPTKNDLVSQGELSLFGFGQGKLTVTPMQICSVLCTIGNGGTFNQPRLVLKGVNDKGEMSQIIYPQGKKVLSKSTCDNLIRYMRYVVTNGTASSVMYNDRFSAGKTATAQTGQYIRNTERLNTWFAGVYPYNNPKYAIVVMTENGSSGAGDCCPIFSTIVENIDKM